MIGAIILAAGKSQRMGSPKALLSFHRRTFLQHILDAVAQSKAGPAVVVTGHHRDEIQRVHPGVGMVFNPHYESGMVTSIQCGILALPREVEGALLFLVDHPVVEPAIIDALIDCFVPGAIVLPTFHGRRGHPVLFSRPALDEILALPETSGANIVVRREPSRVIEVAVASPGVVTDIDTPEQFESFLQDQS